jgi:hypothetical protein
VQAVRRASAAQPVAWEACNTIFSVPCLVALNPPFAVLPHIPAHFASACWSGVFLARQHPPASPASLLGMHRLLRLLQVPNGRALFCPNTPRSADAGPRRQISTSIYHSIPSRKSDALSPSYLRASALRDCPSRSSLRVTCLRRLPQSLPLPCLLT